MKLLNCIAAAAMGVLMLGSAQAETRLITLGTQGGPMPGATRSQPANALIVNDRVYLIDAGNGVSQQLVKAGLDIRKVGHIFITHNHDDHNADWGNLMGFQWATGRRQPTHVYGPAGTERMLKGFLEYFGPNTRIRMADSKGMQPPEKQFMAHDIAGDGVVYRDDLITVTAAENCHFGKDGAGASGAEHSYSFRIQTPDKVIVFSGDTGNCDAVLALSKDADLMVHEVIDLALIEKALMAAMPAHFAQGLMRHMRDEHTTAEDVGRLAKAAGVKQLVLTHIIPGQEEPDSTYLDPAKKHYDGPVTVARDLMSF
ncbi:MBL fold metallo-hydrolase [Hydrogenophaga crassostreae]|uniref:MBL fold metallo-hydrolase n=1 Tax=Hydrogenophaga crassostreae TaxID=1763535 RepID=A0A162YXC6_9BURK|nr:MBL fold metallo-hydrolase [Hydrogenophaga crassostreae]AOW12043.1 MBL fold metallo-hydrolase [Hydrogenophaga crassostreae]OAD40987.1 MBL fold metallo-hydrolase [Hydrogenophaga crassostreae]